MFSTRALGLGYIQNIIYLKNANEIVARLVKIIADSLIEDVTLRNWCQSNYSSTQNIYSGFDKRYPPSEENMPCIVLSNITESSGFKLDKNTFCINLTCGINDNSWCLKKIRTE